ncbi:glutamate-1-semialdehyde-2,1-aminomutase [Sphingobacterium psychroaquaticum]|uniref:glutamate-1-semialdehyde 2,1-aminomutase n=1 Tax=Sphingobacterium psychroaquaticum TaxID=561061 RepID=UPI0010692983|nr:glutamate-1-semialdehyde 2,1-aminomutase [Sphingobacterium psychroaquaticum]QBQ40315.1 glutamate-1-semialdehyde-2,1-aminomutase [Sphingobacterium psychroaquaticum]
MHYTRSSELFRHAQCYIPGGVNSPVRAFKNVDAVPVFIKRAKGAYLYDEDGNEYIDYVNSWGPMLYGHAFPPVIQAIIDKAKLGTSFGAPTTMESQIAQLAVSMVPGIEKIRFVNSGTEAAMSAVRLARGYVGKRKIIKFAGCYHGHADGFLIAGGSGLSTLGIASSAGVTESATVDTLLASYNDLESVRSLFRKFKGEIAAVIVEPVAGNMGCVPPDNGFLKGLRNICTHYEALLIFDEVMTGFRLAKGGAQEYFKVLADIVVFGKIVGGGLPVGAFAAKSDIMNELAPVGAVYQAGTLSGNPLAMAAGYEMLRAITEDGTVYERLERKGQYLEDGMTALFRKYNIDFTINRAGSMCSIFFCRGKITNFETAHAAANDMFTRFFNGMLKNGIYLPPSSYETWFLSDALSFNDLDRTLEAVDLTIRQF